MSRELLAMESPGVCLGKYQVIRHIATGGMGAIYKARDVELGRVVALKILPPDLAKRPGRIERFRREACHAARLHHENIVTLYEFGEDQDLFYLAMEFIDGVDLADYIRDQGNRLDPEEARLIMTQAARALEHAFEEGIVHRDIKPSNFLITRKGTRLSVKLTDLGIAREVEGDELRVTGFDRTVGTIDYMAPEQARNSRAADIRSDIYSLGCTLYQMLSGRPPFQGSVTEQVCKHCDEIPTDIRQINPRVPPGLAIILAKMLAKNPDDRYQTPADLLRDLGRVDELGRPKKSRTASRDVRSDSSVEEISRRRARGQTEPKKSSDEQIRNDRDRAIVMSPAPKLYRIAKAQFERASEAVAKGNYDYGIRLLLSSCKLDPANLIYRQRLREAAEGNARQRTHLSLVSGFYVWILRARIKAAKRAHNFVKVLECGEQLLVHEPYDFGTQMDMALAAQELRLLNSAVWMLEQLREQHPQTVIVWRALARLYEERRDFKEAGALWESVYKANPTDPEAYQKTQDLAAAETIARGGYEEMFRQPKAC